MMKNEQYPAADARSPLFRAFQRFLARVKDALAEDGNYRGTEAEKAEAAERDAEIDRKFG